MRRAEPRAGGRRAALLAGGVAAGRSAAGAASCALERARVVRGALLDQPTPGQDYFKLPLDAALAELLTKETQLTRPSTPSCAGSSRRGCTASTGGARTRASFRTCCVFRSCIYRGGARRAAPLRGALALRQRRFAAISGSPRAPNDTRGSYPAAPDEARLTRVAKPGDDLAVLHRYAAAAAAAGGADREHRRLLRGAALVRGRFGATACWRSRRPCSKGVASGGETEPERLERAEELKAAAAARQPRRVEAWLGRLIAAVRRLLEQASSRARVYAVGIVIDGTQAEDDLAPAARAGGAGGGRAGSLEAGFAARILS